MRRILLALAIGLTLVALPGVGFAIGDEETVRLLQRAADQGNAAARNNLGVLYRDGGGGLTKDDREALRLFKLAADQGNAYAQQNLGGFYRDGRGGLGKDDREAVRLFKLAADRKSTRLNSSH